MVRMGVSHVASGERIGGGREGAVPPGAALRCCHIRWSRARCSLSGFLREEGSHEGRGIAGLPGDAPRHAPTGSQDHIWSLHTASLHPGVSIGKKQKRCITRTGVISAFSYTRKWEDSEKCWDLYIVFSYLYIVFSFQVFSLYATHTR